MHEKNLSEKGIKSATRILDNAENSFAFQGFNASSMREIATASGLKVAGLYKYFDSKEGLYLAVLERALAPIHDLLDQAINHPSSETTANLSDNILDVFHENPNRAALFMQTLRHRDDEVSLQLINQWLDDFLHKGARLVEYLSAGKMNRNQTSLFIINLFNLCAGYFTSEPILERVWRTSATGQANLATQKHMVRAFIQASLS